MLTLTGVGHTFAGRGGEVEALRDINLEIPTGQRVCIVGPSGCGKSTLLRLMAGFTQPTTGQISGAESRGMVFQEPNLYPWLNLRDNVRLAGTFSGDKEHLRAADELLQVVGLDKAAERFPHELSGGMQQRAQIARVLAPRPETVLMDEPFGALDPFTREKLQAELLRVWRLYEPTIVFITHSVEEALLLGERVSWARTVMLALGFAGVLLVVRPGGEMGTGMIFAVLAGTLYGSYLAATRWLTAFYPPPFLLGSQLLIGAVLLLPAGLASIPASTDLRVWVLVIVSSLASAFGNYLLVVVNRTTPATVSAPLIYFQLIAATVIGFLVFGNWPEPLTLLGLAVIFASGVGGLALVPRR